MWVLETDDAENESLVFRLASGAVKTVGRSPGADLVVDAALVSRLHCRLSADEPGIEVVDLNSTNGTFVNGKRVRQATLLAGDSLMVGRVVFRISRA